MKKITLNAGFHGFLISLPTIAVLVIIAMHFSIPWLEILIGALCLSGLVVRAQINSLQQEINSYEKQKISGKYSNTRSTGVSGVLLMLFYLCNSMSAFFWFVVLLPIFSNFTKNDPWYEQLVAVLLFLVVVLGSFVLFLGGSLKLLNQNYTGYRIITIPLSEYEILGKGSKKFSYSLYVMIYGNENDPDNIDLIKKVVSLKVSLLQKQLQEKIDKDSNLAKQKEKEDIQAEKDFEINEWTQFKRKNLLNEISV